MDTDIVEFDTHPWIGFACILQAQLLSNLTLKVSAVEELLQKGKGPMEGFFV